MEEKDKNKRRELLALGLIAGAGVLTGAGIHKVISDAGSEKIKMITASGEVVEVDARHVTQKGAITKVSNAELKKWMEDEKG
ncbi:MAG: preprotein translocase subunit YajC [Ulvibacter sp.]|jgi:preprotein translocase subunit YajC